MNLPLATVATARLVAGFFSSGVRAIGAQGCRIRRALWTFVLKQFWGGHPNTFRGFFAWASLSYAVYMIHNPIAWAGRPYDLMRLCAPLYVWAFLFGLHWMLINYILHKGASRGWQFVVNFFGFSLWTAYVTLQDMSLGDFAINSAMERIAVLYSVWAMLRTGMGRRIVEVPETRV